jgi:hypothetical protein
LHSNSTEIICRSGNQYQEEKAPVPADVENVACNQKNSILPSMWYQVVEQADTTQENEKGQGMKVH